VCKELVVMRLLLDEKNSTNALLESIERAQQIKSGYAACFQVFLLS